MMPQLPRKFELPDRDYALKFYEKLLKSKERKIVFGNNIYSKSVIQNYKIDAIVDDFTDVDFDPDVDIPIIRTKDIKSKDIVVVCSGGNILRANAKVRDTHAESIDYFHFRRYSEFPLIDIRFNEGFEEEYLRNYERFQATYNRLEDNESKNIFIKLIAFRFSGNVKYMKGFSDKQNKMYLEYFLFLKNEGEVFYDIGAFDGQNSDQFISACPNYLEINMFEPDPSNFTVLQRKYEKQQSINLHNIGLGGSQRESKIVSSGSTSTINSFSGATVNIQQLDMLMDSITPPTFLKMDIEGGEKDAIQGSQQTIKLFTPKMAISIYHKTGDFWEIPEQINYINPNYKLKIRHYTESIYETVAFFTL
jgi:FkbM family methyltransferase